MCVCVCVCVSARVVWCAAGSWRPKFDEAPGRRFGRRWWAAQSIAVDGDVDVDVVAPLRFCSPRLSGPGDVVFFFSFFFLRGLGVGDGGRGGGWLPPASHLSMRICIMRTPSQRRLLRRDGVGRGHHSPAVCRFLSLSLSLSLSFYLFIHLFMLLLSSIRLCRESEMRPAHFEPLAAIYCRTNETKAIKDCIDWREIYGNDGR